MLNFYDSFFTIVRVYYTVTVHFYYSQKLKVKKKKIKRGLVVKKIDFEKDILIIHYPLEDLEERCLL